jgi:hemolysin-activating ACP:hemolysin acyltransferase
MLNGRDEVAGDVSDTAGVPPAPDPELLAKLGALRQRVQSSVGQVVLAMMSSPRYRHQSLGDLAHLVIEPLSRDRIAVAMATSGGEQGALAGVALWATVSQAADAAIREQIKAGVFPIRLKPEDWTGGEIVWLLDVIAPTRKLATSVLASFGALAKDRPVNIHPLVARLVDPEALAKMRPAPAASAGADDIAPGAAS